MIEADPDDQARRLYDFAHGDGSYDRLPALERARIRGRVERRVPKLLASWEDWKREQTERAEEERE